MQILHSVGLIRLLEDSREALPKLQTGPPNVGHANEGKALMNDHGANGGTDIKGIHSPLSTSDHRFDSWKQIAVYLGRQVRTVQRWEKREDLPVRRHIHLKGSTVYAFKKEIDAWLASRNQTLGQSRPIPKRSRRAANGLNPPPHVIRHLLSAFRLWLAFEAHEECQDSGNAAVVADLRMAPDDRNIFTERLKSQRSVSKRQRQLPGACRVLSLAEEGHQ